MPYVPTPPSQSGSEALLSEWEEARPANAAPVTLELRTAFTRFVAEVLSDTQETNLHIADVHEVLRGAAGLTIGRGEASGPGRAQQALQEAYQAAQAVSPHAAPRGRILLLVQSRPDTELEMDELTDITETMWLNAARYMYWFTFTICNCY